MAETPKDLEGWEVITTDLNGNILTDNRRRSRKRGRADKEYLQHVATGIKFGRGDSVIMNDVATNTYSVYLINEIRLNTLNNMVEIWAYSYLRWFELKPLLYYTQFCPELAAEKKPTEFYRERFLNDVDKGEIYLTAELSEIWLKDFVAVANIMEESQWNNASTAKTPDRDFFLRYMCEPTAENFVAIDLAKERKILTESDPKSYEEHLKRISVPAVSYQNRSSKVKSGSNRLKSIEVSRTASIRDIKIEEDSDTDIHTDQGEISSEKKKKKMKKDMINAKEIPHHHVENGEGKVRQNHEETINTNTTSTARFDSSSSPPSDAYDDAQETPESSPDFTSTNRRTQNELSRQGKIDDGLEREGKAEPPSSAEGDSSSLSGEYDTRASDEENESENLSFNEDDVDSAAIKRVSQKAAVQGKQQRKSRKLESASTPTPSSRPSNMSNPVARKFTKRNVARAKKKYTPFSKRFNSVNDIPDLTKLAEFNQSSNDLDVAALENKLRTPKKHELVETIFSKIKKQLYSSHDKEEIVKSGSFQDYLPARENEFASIYLSIYSAIESGSATTVYVAGTPGVGKTLTVREVIKELQRSADQNELPIFQFVEINGLKMVKPTDSYEVLWNKIMGERLTWGAAMESLEFYFNKVPKNKKRPVVVLLDELDALVTKTQDIMYNFFNWTTYENAKLIVIAVANTMDLPERQLGNKVSSRIGFTRIMFTGYTYEELKKIIDFRLKGLNNSYFYEDRKTGNAYIMDPEVENGKELPPHIKMVQLKMSDDAIEIASRKVASVSGDARRALKVCKRAAEIAEQHYMAKHGYGYDGHTIGKLNATEESDEEDANDEEGLQTVHISHIMKALNETINSQSTKFITRLSFTGKLFLYALLNLIKKSGLQEQQLGDIIDEIKLLIDVNANNKYVVEISRVLFHKGSEVTPEQLRIVSWDFIINQLIEAGIIIKQSMKNEKISCVKLNISSEDIRKALDQDESLKGL